MSIVNIDRPALLLVQRQGHSLMTMTEIEDQFIRLREEHARLHDPSVLRGAVELVPLDLRQLLAGRDRKKKNKRKRHSATSAGIRTGEQLLPVEFLNHLTDENPGEKTRKTSSQAATLIEVDPPNVALSLKLFQELNFALDTPATNQVELVWRTSDDTANEKTRTALQQVVMDHRYADRFETQIGIADGDYQFGFKVDGHMRVDERFSQHLLLTREGLFTRRRLRRHSQLIRLTNRGASDEVVRFKTKQGWLIPPAGLIDLPAHSSIPILVRLFPPLMQVGLNEGTLQLSMMREEHEVETGTVQFLVTAEADGAIPSISLSPVDLGQLRQGMDRAELSVRIAALGRGPLNGMISLPHSAELTDFHLNADDPERASMTHVFGINSIGLPRPQPHQLEAKLRLMVLTDSFLGNYRICRAEITYSLVHLRKSLPALSFGTVRLGGTKVMRLEVRRSDNQSVELQTVLPTNVASYLHVTTVRPDTCDFRFDTNSLMPGTNINETVELIDRNSGLRDQVKVLGTVARDSLEFSSAQPGPITS